MDYSKQIRIFAPVKFETIDEYNKDMEDNEVMMVSEPAVAYTPTVFDTVIKYLHSSHMPMGTKRAVYLQLQAEVADENLAYMKRRLKEYSKLESGWDGDEAQPVIPQISAFVEQMLRKCDSHELSEWSLFPNVNGTLLLQRKDAAVSIGVDEFSYYAESKNKTIGRDHQPLSLDSVNSAIEAINRYVR